MSIIALPILLSLGANIAAVVVLLSNGINQTSFLYNSSDAPKLGAIDPRFTTNYQQGQGRLSATSCLMNAVNAMMKLALENITEPIRPQELYRSWLSRGRDRTYSVGARAKIWIIAAYRDLSIAGSNGTLGLTARSEEMSIHNATIESTQSLSVLDVINRLNGQHLTVFVTQVGEMLGITEVFVAIFAALAYMAHFPSTDEVARFQITPDDEDTTFGILEHTRAPGVRPPFLEYQWAILSVGKIPGYMLEQRRFTEVVIEIAVDGVLLGKGFLSK
ncbi:MAG: hypothetical protein Q9175_001586 [Cornicularia normoerica]